MFAGQIGKDMMIQQGYVPKTCTMPAEWAGAVIYSEVAKGRDPCAGCNEDRAKCGGRARVHDQERDL